MYQHPQWQELRLDWWGELHRDLWWKSWDLQNWRSITSHTKSKRDGSKLLNALTEFYIHHGYNPKPWTSSGWLCVASGPGVQVCLYVEGHESLQRCRVTVNQQESSHQAISQNILGNKFPLLNNNLPSCLSEPWLYKHSTGRRWFGFGFFLSSHVVASPFEGER